MLIKALTLNVDLELTDVCHCTKRGLHDKISVRRQAAGTLQGDGSSVWHGARVLTTDGVVPQREIPAGRWNIRQTDDEIVRSPAFTNVKITDVI